MEISIAAILPYIFKIIVCIFGIGFAALLTLWPVNDEPVNEYHKTAFVVIAIVIVLITFDIVNITA